jgi:hypothetical protein
VAPNGAVRVTVAAANQEAHGGRPPVANLRRRPCAGTWQAERRG